MTRLPVFTQRLYPVADHCEGHDQINRYLAGNRLRPRYVWENVKYRWIPSHDTVLEKRYAKEIAIAQRQYSGNAGGIINGIGIVTCVYVNPELDRFWVIDYRIYDPRGDGKTKLEHVQEMLSVFVESRALAFSTVLMDSWYATKSVLLHIESLGKQYYCPLKSNRRVDDSNATQPSTHDVEWTVSELQTGKRIKIRGFPKNHKVKVFPGRVVISAHGLCRYQRNQSEASIAKTVCAWRWKIEEFHREAKQLTGLEKCQCRLSRIVRNHIACAFLVWIRLMREAHETGQTLYQVKHGMLSEYLREQLKSPTLKMDAA